MSILMISGVVYFVSINHTFKIDGQCSMHGEITPEAQTVKRYAGTADTLFY